MLLVVPRIQRGRLCLAVCLVDFWPLGGCPDKTIGSCRQDDVMSGNPFYRGCPLSIFRHLGSRKIRESLQFVRQGRYAY